MPAGVPRRGIQRQLEAPGRGGHAGRHVAGHEVPPTAKQLLLVNQFGKPFRAAIGIPRGGIKLGQYLNEYSTQNSDHPYLLVDDVLTTGGSMEEYLKKNVLTLHPADIADLFEILTDEDKDVRYKTQDSLIKILNTVPKAALPELKKALKDDDWRVVYHSIVILTEFAKKYPAPSVALAPEVILAFNSGERLKERAADCIGMLGLANPDAMKPAVPGLIKGLESKSSELRKATATALGRIGSKNAMVVYHAVPRLAKALKNDDWYIHTEVVKALGYIGSNKPALVKPHLALIENRTKTGADRKICDAAKSVSYTHLTLPTNREV